ncbi:MAG: right-handed parallel beta-helix repeat-containing protein, partial [Defluviitaleaceae bacterium]|nr:right-handed parallel beta-helix repeat-containing protein [Defluviitaleaceae bacterium]
MKYFYTFIFIFAFIFFASACSKTAADFDIDPPGFSLPTQSQVNEPTPSPVAEPTVAAVPPIGIITPEPTAGQQENTESNNGHQAGEEIPAPTPIPQPEPTTEPTPVPEPTPADVSQEPAATPAHQSPIQTASGRVGPRPNTSPDPANSVYVSPNGNDSTANGSISAPYKSINTALAAADPGSTIILRGGTYREGVNVRIRKPNITIKSAQNEWAVIDLTVHNAGADEDSGVYFDVGSSGGKLQNVEVMGGFYAVCTETKWDWGDPSDRSGASNILIEDCVLHSSKYDVIKVKPNCNYVTIRFNEIFNSGQAFAGKPKNGEDNAEGIDNVNGANMTVQNNYIHDICSTAVYAKGGATDALIENNLIERAYGAGIMVGFDTSPEFFNRSTNPNYYENIRGVVRNNLIIDTGWEGIGLYASKDANVYNNTLVNVANGGQYHSAIYFGLTYQDWEPHAGRPANVNPSVFKNIVSQPSAIVRPMIEIRYDNNEHLGIMSALEGKPAMHDNCYFISGKVASFTDRRPGGMPDGGGLADWQSHIGG